MKEVKKSLSLTLPSREGKEKWEKKKLGEVCLMITDGDWIEKKDQSEDGIRLIQTGNVGNGIYKDKGEKAKHVSEETFHRLHCTEIFEGDVLVSRLPDPVGRACILPKLEKRCITAVDCSILRLNKNIICSQWLVLYMQSSSYFTIIRSQCTGSTRQRITRKKLIDTTVPVPPLTEQQNIVHYLDESFAKIDALKVNAEKSLADAKALFQAELKKAMEPKEGWEEKKLGEIVENLRTGLNPRTHFKLNTPDATGYYITVRELKGFTFQVDDKTDRINQHAIERINQRSGLQIGDILYSGTGTIGRTSLVTENPTWWNIKEGVYAMTPKAFIDSKYLIYVLQCETIHKRILEKASGTTVKSIPMRELVNITIPLTSLTDQQSIVTHLDTLSAKVTQLQQNFEKIKTECDALKQALLKQVFE